MGLSYPFYFNFVSSAPGDDAVVFVLGILYVMSSASSAENDEDEDVDDDVVVRFGSRRETKHVAHLNESCTPKVCCLVCFESSTTIRREEGRIVVVVDILVI